LLSGEKDVGEFTPQKRRRRTTGSRK
jgi:hypothetical protein